MTNGLALVIPWLMKLAVEGLQHPATTGLAPAACAAAIAAVALVHGVTRIFSRTMVLNAARIIEYRIRNDLFRRLLLLGPGFYGATPTGDIMSRFTNDLTNVRMLAGFGAMSAMNTLIVYGAAITLMVRIDPSLTLWAVLPFPLMVLAVKTVSGRLFQRSLEAQEELARLSGISQESVSAVRLIKSYCREEHFQGLFAGTADRYLASNLRLARLRGAVIPIMAAATGGGTLVVLFLGGRHVIAGSISLGDFVAFSGYLAMLVWPTAVMGWILTLAQRGAASMSRMAAVLTASPEVADHPDALAIDDLRQGIEVRELSFSHGPVRILDSVSFRVGAGERVGITGEVGSGKSTLLNLMLRFTEAPPGTVLFDGRDIRLVRLSSLRRLIGYVPQEAFLFSRTIRENVMYGAEGGGGGVAELIRTAGLEEDVARFSQGMETMVGEKGVMLSGGQRQRMAIARALAVEPRVLVLDDPLSAVDAGREEEILGELRHFYGSRTVLIVSQRLSAFRDCDRVIVLTAGRVVEEGTPAELLARGGVYARMDRMQRLREEMR